MKTLIKIIKKNMTLGERRHDRKSWRGELIERYFVHVLTFQRINFTKSKEGGVERLGQWRRECLTAQMVRAQELTTRFWFVTRDGGSLKEEQCVSQKTENRFQERLEQGTAVREGRIG